MKSDSALLQQVAHGLALWTALVAIIGQKSVVKVFKRWLEAKERQE